MKIVLDENGAMWLNSPEDHVYVTLEGHYGEYGPNCMNTGQLDAGECWLCAVRRNIKAREEAKNGEA